MKACLKIALVLAVAALLCGVFARVQAATSAQAHRSTFSLVSLKLKTLTKVSAQAAERTDTKGSVSKDKHSLTFRQNVVRLVAHTGPDNDMLSYRIAGLRNPTIVVLPGATLKVLFVNTDDDMFHNIRFGAMPASFPNKADSLVKLSVGVAPLPHVSGKSLHGAEIVVKAPSAPGKYAYFCSVRGHAQGGMWGTIQVR